LEYVELERRVVYRLIHHKRDGSVTEMDIDDLDKLLDKARGLMNLKEKDEVYTASVEAKKFLIFKSKEELAEWAMH